MNIDKFHSIASFKHPFDKVVELSSFNFQLLFIEEVVLTNDHCRISKPANISFSKSLTPVNIFNLCFISESSVFCGVCVFIFNAFFQNKSIVPIVMLLIFFKLLIIVKSIAGVVVKNIINLLHKN